MRLSGTTDYTGALLIGGSGYGSVLSTTQNNLIDTRALYSYHYLPAEMVELFVATGIGYRYWRRELSASQVEIYKWFSLRLEGGVVFTILDRISIGLNGSYQYGINPLMEAVGDSQFNSKK